MPLRLPGRGDSPGITTCRRRKGPGWTWNPLLAPLCVGWLSTSAATTALPGVVSSARYTLTLPLQRPDVMLTEAGEIRPAPKLVSWRRRTVPENPLTRSPLGLRAVIVTGNATPAL